MRKKCLSTSFWRNLPQAIFWSSKKRFCLNRDFKRPTFNNYRVIGISNRLESWLSLSVSRKCLFQIALNLIKNWQNGKELHLGGNSFSIMKKFNCLVVMTIFWLFWFVLKKSHEKQRRRITLSSVLCKKIKFLIWCAFFSSVTLYILDFQNGLCRIERTA